MCCTYKFIKKTGAFAKLHSPLLTRVTLEPFTSSPFSTESPAPSFVSLSRSPTPFPHIILSSCVFSPAVHCRLCCDTKKSIVQSSSPVSRGRLPKGSEAVCTVQPLVLRYTTFFFFLVFPNPVPARRPWQTQRKTPFSPIENNRHAFSNL